MAEGFAAKANITVTEKKNLASLALTIFYDNGARHLTIAGKTAFETEIALTGIKFLIEQARNGTIEFCSDIYLDDMRKNQEQTKLLHSSEIRSRINLDVTLRKLRESFAVYEENSLNLGMQQSQLAGFIAPFVQRAKEALAFDLDHMSEKKGDFFVWNAEIEVFALGQVLGAVSLYKLDLIA